DSIIEQSPYPTWISDTKGTMVRANPALKKVLNLSDEQLIGKYNVFQDKQVGTDLLQQIHDALEKGKISEFEIDWIGEKTGIDSMKEGNRVYCEGTIFPIYTQKGAITHAVITYKNVSDRKEAEQALLRNKEEMQAIVNHSVDAIGVSQQGIHRLVNPAYLKMFGYQDANDLIGKPIFELIAPDERKRIKQFVSDRIKGRSVDSHYYTRGLKKDGTEFDMELNVAQYGQEDIKKTIVILRDITDRNR
ncbi:MAG: PAS domain S-box protein, partial [Bacteroidetes bacterium]|nr:PAS domain S-box protein [Bacteroidota bacterium]